MNLVLIGKLLVLISMTFQLVQCLKRLTSPLENPKLFCLILLCYLFIYLAQNLGQKVLPELFRTGTRKHVILVLRYISVYKNLEKNKLERVREGIGMKNAYMVASLKSS